MTKHRFTWKRPVGGPIAYLVFQGFIIWASSVAVTNLVYLRPLPLSALIGSLLWLALVFFFNIAQFQMVGGIRHYCINYLSGFSLSHFIQVEENDSDGKLLTAGFTIASVTFYNLKVSAGGVQTVDWQKGQRSSIRGEDMNDWHVIVWYDDGSALMDSSGYHVGNAGVGLEGAKSRIENYGATVIAFLRDNGVRLPSPSASLIGKEGVAIEKVDPIGKVEIAGEQHMTHSQGNFLSSGDAVVVSGICGTSVEVTPVSN